jgi:hypothetical protein
MADVIKNSKRKTENPHKKNINSRMKYTSLLFFVQEK